MWALHAKADSLDFAQGRLLSHAKGMLLQDDKLNMIPGGPMGLGCRTAEGGCPHMSCGAAT
jgi:hypothetical protein